MTRICPWLDNAGESCGKPARYDSDFCQRHTEPDASFYDWRTPDPGRTQP